MLIAPAHASLSMKISRIIDEAFIRMLNAKEWMRRFMMLR